MSRLDVTDKKLILRGDFILSDRDMIETFFLDIAESQEFSNIEYLFFTIRRGALEYISRKREADVEPFMRPLHDFIKNEFTRSCLEIDDLLSYMLENDDHGWSFFFMLTFFKRKEGISEGTYYSAVSSRTNISSFVEWDLDRFATLILGFSIDKFRKHRIDIREIVGYEKFAYETNQYGLSKVNGAAFKRDGLIFNHKYYLYNILTNTSVIEFTDDVPGFAKIINEQINSGDILYRLDERLSVPEDQVISYTTLDFEKFYGPQFNFRNSVLNAKKTIIVHIDEKTMDKLLLVIKQCQDESHETFWHIEIEMLPYIDKQKCKTDHIITTFLHGMYYPDRDVFTHIDYTKNQYELKDYLLKYSESINEVPIDFYTAKELHYKIWCVENGEYSRNTWYAFMITSLTPS